MFNQHLAVGPRLVLTVLAAVLFFLAGIGGGWSVATADWYWRGRLIAWGLFCLCVSEFF
jgi:hypothetical protein